MIKLWNASKDLWIPDNWLQKENETSLFFFGTTLLAKNLSNTKSSYLFFLEQGSFNRTKEQLKTKPLKKFTLVFKGHSNKSSGKIYIVEYKNKEKKTIHQFPLNSSENFSLHNETNSIRIAIKLEAKENIIITDLSLKEKMEKTLSPYLKTSFQIQKKAPLSTLEKEFFNCSTWSRKEKSTALIYENQRLLIGHRKDDELTFQKKIWINSYEEYSLFFSWEAIKMPSKITVLLEEYNGEIFLKRENYFESSQRIKFQKDCNQIVLKIILKESGVSILKLLKFSSPLRNTINTLTAVLPEGYFPESFPR